MFILITMENYLPKTMDFYLPKSMDFSLPFTLPHDLRFFHIPLPALSSVSLAIYLAIIAIIRAYHVSLI